MIVRSRFSADVPTRTVTVTAGSRVHLGFYGFDDEHRVFGGLGLAIDKPVYRVTVTISDRDRVEGCQADRLREALSLARRSSGFDKPASVTALSCIPEHVGLGSTTQLLLTLHTSLCTLAGRRVDIYEAARRLGRGRVSGIGVAAFVHGGFIVDTGAPPGAGDYVVKPLVRIRFPSSWTLVVAIPRTRWRVDESAEPSLFAASGGLSRQERLYLLYVVFRRLLPSLVDGDFTGFTSALEEVQRLTGTYFSGAQGGLFCCPESEHIANILRALDGKGIGQSSWGPLVYAFYPSHTRATKALQALTRIAEREGVELEAAWVAKPRNHGALVEIVEPRRG